MVGLSTDFYNYLMFILLVSLFVIMSNAIGMLIGATIFNIKQAMTLSIVAVMGSTLLGGFFVARENLPDFIGWARWISFVKYGMASPSTLCGVKFLLITIRFVDFDVCVIRL